MSLSDTASNEAQQGHSTSAAASTGDTLDAIDQQVEPQNGALDVPRPTRPAMTDRMYSAHFYTLSRQHARPVAGGLNAPEQVCLPGFEHECLPADALVAVRPSRRTIQRTNTDYSTSSGLTLNEITPPQAMLDNAEAHGPGMYRFVVQSPPAPDPFSVYEGSDVATHEKIATVNYAVQCFDKYNDKIASQEYLEDITKAYPLPETSGPKWWNRLRHGIFSTYHRLFTLVLLGNLVTLLYYIWTTTQDLDHISNTSAATAAGANLFVGTLMRHEHCINFLFRFFVALPLWLSVSIRRLAAKIYCYGGIHSACGISGFAWYIYFMVLFFLQIDAMTAVVEAVACLAGVEMLLFAMLIVMSHPYLRSRFHNQWELSHRFFGWTSVGIIWAQILLITCSSANTSNDSLGRILIKTPAFWFLIGITMLIVYPWLRLRRMTFSAEQLSSHAIRLWFNNSNKVLPTTVGIRLSTSPMTETHAFATIPNADNRPGFSVLVSNAGDWTKRLINHPPAYVWARGAHTVGVLRVALLFKPIVIVATGSGIGPCLSLLQVHPHWPCRVVWSARFPEATYGKEVMDSVFRADKNAVVIDTKKTGKPDLVGIVHAVYKEVGAEAVMIISNPFATREVVYELESRKIPAFGAIFDS